MCRGPHRQEKMATTSWQCFRRTKSQCEAKALPACRGRSAYLNVTTIAEELAACENDQSAYAGPVTNTSLSSMNVSFAVVDASIVNPDPATGGVAGSGFRYNAPKTSSALDVAFAAPLDAFVTSDCNWVDDASNDDEVAAPRYS